jgi:hypothetical protein
MGLLSSLLALLLPLASAAPTTTSWVVLPTEGPTALSARVDSAVASLQIPGVYRHTLAPASADRLRKDPDCRRQPLCRAANTPEGTTFLLDIRLKPVNGTIATAEVYLWRPGGTGDRLALFLPIGRLESQLRAELARLTSPLAPAVGLAVRAEGGDTAASHQLQAEYPESPWASPTPVGQPPR